MIHVRRIFYALFFAIVIHNGASIARIEDPLSKPKSFSEKISDIWNTGKSGALFHLSLGYNRFMYGSSFTFNRINSLSDKSGVGITRDSSGNITEIRDGRGPLVLGSIPRNESDLALLRKNFFGSSKNTQVNLYTLTRDFENRWAGLTKLVKEHKGDIFQYRYPTTDFTAPSFVDFLRGVRDVKNRDNKVIAYVHCKAGRGRSATLIIAYLMTILYEHDIQVTLQEIIDYVRLRRPQINVDKQMKALNYFVRQLRKFGTLDTMLAKYHGPIAQSDAAYDESTLLCPIR